MSIPVGQGPCTPTLDPANGRLYVSNVWTDNVSVLNASDGARIATIAVGTSPQAPAVDPAIGELFVSNYGSGNVSIINTSSNAVVATIPVGVDPRAPTFDAATGTVYVPNEYSSNVSVINASRNQITSTLTLGSGPETPVLDPATGRLFIAENGSATVAVIDPANESFVANISVANYPIAPAVDPMNDTIYVPNVDSNSVSVINGSTLTVVETLGAHGQPWTPLFDAGNDRVYIPNQAATWVTIVNASDNSIIGGLDVGLGPYTPVLGPSGDIYVPVYDRSSVAVISGQDSSLLATVPVGSFPATPTYVASAGALYVPNFGSSNVTVIQNLSRYTPHSLTFAETGLPFGQAWSVTTNSSSREVNSTRDVFTVANGEYGFTVGNAAGYRPTPSAGEVWVNGTDVQVLVRFQLPFATCAGINTNATLDGVYLNIYDGVNNLSKNWTGTPNESRPANQSAYPNVTLGERQLEAAWTSICESAPYETLYGVWGWNSTTSGSELDPNGFFDVNFGFVYHASCNNSTRPPGPNESSCEWFTTWYVNASSGFVTGPMTSVGYNGGGGPPPAGGGTPLGSGSNPASPTPLPTAPSHAARAGGSVVGETPRRVAPGGPGVTVYVAVGIAMLTVACLVAVLRPRRGAP